VSNNSDYNKVRTRIDKLLPEPNQSEINESILENTINRMLSPKETTFVDGYVGQNNRQAINSRQIPESSIIRQANQLQPILSAKLGSEKKYLSWEDVINELTLQGVDMEKFSDWGSAEKFNWVPPIDIDKIINYRDYFWVDTNANSQLEYITIKSHCSAAQAKVDGLNAMVERFGNNFEIIGNISSKEVETFQIVSISQGTDIIRILEDKTDDIQIGDFITVQGTSFTNKEVEVVNIEYTDPHTLITVTEDSIVENESIGTIAKTTHTGIQVSGDLTSLFEVGFVLFVKDSDNTQLNNKFITVKSSTTDDSVTDIIIDASFSSKVTGGIISLSEQISLAQATADCECGVNSGGGYGVALYDDNPNNSGIWDGDYQELLTQITNDEDPKITDGDNEDLWYSKDSDTIFQKGANIGWKPLFADFSTVLSSVTGNATFDFSESCEVEVPPAQIQWTSNNKWVHRNGVSNFASARQASYPIIEFLSGIEINEYIEVVHKWKYRSEKSLPFVTADKDPVLFELVGLHRFEINSDSEIVFDAIHGNLTDTFKTGYEFTADTADIYTVISSRYEILDDGTYSTIVEIDKVLAEGDVATFNPIRTSYGDFWIGYNQHWVYEGVDYDRPTGNKVFNTQNTINDDAILNTEKTHFDYKLGTYAQLFISKSNVNTTFIFSDTTLRNKAVADSDSIRVYLNGERQYGTYEELRSLAGEGKHVIGIRMSGVQELDELIIEVAPATLSDLGYNTINVRTELNDSVYNSTLELETVSLNKFKKIEQIKTSVNQAPIFNLFDVDGSPLNKTSEIFSFKTDQSYSVIPELGKRVIYDSLTGVFTFTQDLLGSDNSLYGYNLIDDSVDYWVDEANKTVYKLDNFVWTDFFLQGTNIINKAEYSSTQPSKPFNGMIWYDSTARKLYEYSESAAKFFQSSDMVVVYENPALNSIWKKSNEEYIPVKRDWYGRSLSEYNEEKDAFLSVTEESIKFNNPLFSDAEVESQALSEWLMSQENSFSEDGSWVGDWTLPDYFYYNVENENRVDVTTTEIVGHFSSIIEDQDKISGFLGNKQTQFHALQAENIDYGRGGTIRQYNNNFSTFLSSIFIDNVIVPDLIDFAQTQYEILLDKVRKISTQSLVQAITEDLGNFDTTSKLSDITKKLYAEDSNLEFLYGDTTSGAKNWIATLPNFGIVSPVEPNLNIDKAIQLYELSHHDSHRTNYIMNGAEKATVLSNVIDALQEKEKIVVKTVDAPKLYQDLLSEIGSNLPNEYFWHNSATDVLYQLVIDYIQPNVPTPVEDTFWFNTNTELGALLYSDGTDWVHVLDGSKWELNDNELSDGALYIGDDIATSDISMWEIVDVNEIMVKSILSFEQDLFTQSKEKDFPLSTDTFLESYFLKYVNDQNIDLPFTNSIYSPIDAFSWNYYNSIPGTGYDMIFADPDTNTFTLDQLTAGSFATSSTFSIKNAGANDGEWTVKSVEETSSTTVITVKEDVTSTATGILYKGVFPSTNNTGAESSAYWKGLYLRFYGTPYPNQEPWILQGYNSKPAWWDEEYLNYEPSIYGNRKWRHIEDSDEGMWKNIRLGIVPSGKDLPNGDTSDGSSGSVVKYSYFSVNITDAPISDDGVVFYNPDDLLPPYFDHSAVESLDLISTTRSLFDNFSLHVISPNADYTFGQNSIYEYDWRVSSQYLYSTLIQIYLENPIKFLLNTFGGEYLSMGGLSIDKTTKNVPSNKSVTFHGSILDNELTKVRGLNQWYINYNRYTGIDTNFSNFHKLWKTWTAPLSYQFNSFIDVNTFDVTNNSVDIEQNVDYDIFIKKSSGVESISAQGLVATLISIPPKSINNDNSSEWKIQLSNKSSNNVTFDYYPTLNFPFHVNTTTNTCTIYQYKIANIELIQQVIEVDGDITDILVNGQTISSDDGAVEFTIDSSNYNDSLKRTQIKVRELPVGITGNDLITVDNRILPWNTGDSVWLTTNGTLPAPLLGDTGRIGPVQYFIIKINDTQFQLAETLAAATALLPIDIINSGDKVHHIGEFNNTFMANGGKNTVINWRHYKLDTRSVYSFKMPTVITGIQSFIDLIDGYVKILSEKGFDFSDNVNKWQSQIEEFINYCYSSRNLLRNRTIDNLYEIKPSVENGSWSFLGVTGTPFPTSTPVNIVATDGNMPTPFLQKIPYYVINNGDGTFNLANSATRSELGVEVPLLDIGSAEKYELHVAVENTIKYPQIEVNSFKDKLVFNPSYGVVSDIISGPFDDIQIAKTILDRNGDPLSIRDLVITRTDKKTEIFLANDLRSDLSFIPNVLDPINVEEYHYISAATLFIDTYEHVVEFKNYTIDNKLIYDGFIGLNLDTLSVNFNRQTANTCRPNIGGSSLVKNTNKLETFDNLERSITDLREAYGSPTRNESNRFAPFAKRTLGYDINSTENYLNDLNINEKSQFQFWQGLIQTKGSTRSIDAFINSKQFIDAKLDEFWAYEVAEYGSVEEQEYPELFVGVEDVTDNNIKLEFVENASISTPGLDNNPYDVISFDATDGTDLTSEVGFTPITINDNERWYRQPDQFATLSDNGLVMYFESLANKSIELDNTSLVSQDAPLIIHNFKSDQLIITVDFGYDAYDRYDDSDFTVDTNTLTIRNKVLPFTSPVIVVKNGLILEETTDYYVATNTSGTTVFSDKVKFTKPLVAGDVIEVSYNDSILISDLHYLQINSNAVRFKSNELFSTSAKIVMYGTQPNFESNNASKLIDNKSDTVVSNLNLFDPARGMYNTLIINAIDIISEYNPATTTTKLDNIIDETPVDEFINKDFWGKHEVGTIWVDTSELSYMPYYDESVFSNVDDRLRYWGKQAYNSRLTAWEWVESPVHPSEYDEIAEAEEGDADIREFNRLSGNADRIVYRKVLTDDVDVPFELQRLKNEVREFTVLESGVSTGTSGEFEFPLDEDFLNSPIFGTRTYDIIVNGILKTSNIEMPVPEADLVVTVDGLTEKDTVVLLHEHSYTEEELETALELEIVQVGYEYTEKTSFNKNGSEITNYYFWVKNKLTRSRNKNISPKNIENTWSNVDYPYIVLQKPVARSKVLSVETEEYVVSFNDNVSTKLRENTVSALQLDTQSKYDGSGFNGIFTTGSNYEVGDEVTLSNGATVEITTLVPVGKVNGFTITYTGDLVTQHQVLTQASTTGAGTGFTIRPNRANIGGLYMNLSVPIKYVSDETPVYFKLSVNGTELNVDSQYRLDDTARNIDIMVDLPVDSNISLEYTSERATDSTVLPARYTQAIIRNIRSYISESNRYTVRFRKDFTQDDSSSDINNKNLHKEWKLFREHQNFKVDRELWDKITESMIGYTLTDSSVRVPSIDRSIYDQQTGSDTRFGIKTGQSFTDGTIAINTILADLNNLENEFIGIDISSFLTLNSFDTPDDIVTLMENMYNTFKSEDINRIFFLILNDALSLKNKYEKFLKTSMISVYGVKVLETQRFFDD